MVLYDGWYRSAAALVSPPATVQCEVKDLLKHDSKQLHLLAVQACCLILHCGQKALTDELLVKDHIKKLDQNCLTWSANPASKN